MLPPKNILKTEAQRSSDSLLLGSGGSGFLYNFNTLCGSFNDFADGIRSSFSVDHDRETFEISQVGTSLGDGKLLVSRAGFPFGFKTIFSDGLGESASSGTTEDWDSELGEGESTNGINNSGEAFTVNENLLSVDYVNNDNELSIVGTIINEANSSSFHECSVNLSMM